MGSWLPTKLKAREESKSSQSFDEKVLSANPRLETRESSNRSIEISHFRENTCRRTYLCRELRLSELIGVRAVSIIDIFDRRSNYVNIKRDPSRVITSSTSYTFFFILNALAKLSIPPILIRE